MTDFNPYELNKELQSQIRKSCNDQRMVTFLEWLLTWEGERLHFKRTPTLDDIKQKADQTVGESGG